MTAARPALAPHAVPWTSVAIDDPFWSPRLTTLVEVTLPSQYAQLRASGRLAALGIWDGAGDAPSPHVFWDSDIAKWIEAVAYAQTWHPDAALRRKAEEIIGGYARLQMANGYLNQAFQSGRIHQRWTNLRDDHELYCAGHLIEAAVAWQQALGDDRFLRIMLRVAEHIWQRFGPAGEAGIPGHEEIELALVRLAGVTGEARWLELARLFVERRGTKPSYWAIEQPRHGRSFHAGSEVDQDQQTEIPMRHRQGIEGHAVRALYLIAGTLDVADRTGDEALRDGALRAWRRTIERRMYVTGGFGSHHNGERFTADYDLPDREAYAESCASIAACLIARRVLNVANDAAAGDVLERAMHNGVLAGWSADGQHYFYANPLRSEPGMDGMHKRWRPQAEYRYQRQQWFGCACCPPNIARFYASLGGYLATVRDGGLDLHLPLGCRITQGEWAVTISGDYVGTGRTLITIDRAPAGAVLRIRRPSWAGAVHLTRSNAAVAMVEEAGYLVLRDLVPGNGAVTIDWDLAPRRIWADPRIADSAGRTAIQRGPFIYCLEACDHPDDLASLRLGTEATLTDQPMPALGPCCVAVSAEGVAATASTLYDAHPPEVRPARLTAVPYALWANRTPGAMRVWLPAP